MRKDDLKESDIKKEIGDSVMKKDDITEEKDDIIEETAETAAKEDRPGIPEEPVKAEKWHGWKRKKDKDGEGSRDNGADELTAKLLKIEKKQLFYARLAAAFTCGMFLVMLYIAISLVPRAVDTLNNANEALDSVHGTIAEAQLTLGDEQVAYEDERCDERSDSE